VTSCSYCDARLPKAQAAAERERRVTLKADLARERRYRVMRQAAAAADEKDAAANRSQSVRHVSGGLPTLGKDK
jgi:hypothetical protein